MAVLGGGGPDTDFHRRDGGPAPVTGRGGGKGGLPGGAPWRVGRAGKKFHCGTAQNFSGDGSMRAKNFSAARSKRHGSFQAGPAGVEKIPGGGWQPVAGAGGKNFRDIRPARRRLARKLSRIGTRSQTQSPAR